MAKYACLVLMLGCVSGIEPPGPTTLIPIKGGKFLFGSTKLCHNVGTEPKVTCESNTLVGLPKVYPPVMVEIKDFFIEEHEVTNFQYEYCVAMGKCPPPTYTNAADITDYYGNPLYRNYPVVNVTYEMAKAYCAFVGRRLPNEIEWERVAAGPATTEEQKRMFPFMNGKEKIEECVGKSVAIKYCNGENRPRQVKSSVDDYVEEDGKRIWDLAGNVAEWVEGYWQEGITCKSFFENKDCDCFTCSSSKCIEECYNVGCPECWDNAENKPNQACFRECTTDTHFGFPICIKYPDDKIFTIDELIVKSGAERLTRGGAFTDDKNATCKASSTDRSRHFTASMSHTAYGFRCAKD